MTARRVAKPKLLLDEGLPPRNSFPKLNRYCNIKHIKHDFKLPGILDSAVYEIARSTGRIVVSYNVKDFKMLIKKDSPSVIGLSARLSNNQIDKKVTSFVKNMSGTVAKGHYFSITGETKK